MSYTPEQQQEHIRELQQYLAALSRYAPLPFLAADGIYGTATADAVRAFQEQNQLKPTGIADSETWDAITNAYQNLVREPVLMVSVFPDGAAPYAPGDSGASVYLIQALLLALAEQFEPSSALSSTGTYDAATQQAVRQFQNSVKLPSDGITDVHTWNSLLSALAANPEAALHVESHTPRKAVP